MEFLKSLQNLFSFDWDAVFNTEFSFDKMFAGLNGFLDSIFKQ